MGDHGYISTPANDLATQVLLGRTERRCTWWRRLLRRPHEYESSGLVLTYQMKGPKGWEGKSRRVPAKRCQHCRKLHPDVRVDIEPQATDSTFIADIRARFEAP
mgnify:CR=1 FL=1